MRRFLSVSSKKNEQQFEAKKKKSSLFLFTFTKNYTVMLIKYLSEIIIHLTSSKKKSFR